MTEHERLAAQPRFLNGIVCLRRRAEHAVCHGTQVSALLFEVRREDSRASCSYSRDS